VGRRVARCGAWPGAGDDALRVVSRRLVRGVSRARRRDAGLGRRGLLADRRWDFERAVAGARRVAHLRGVAGVWRRGVAGVWWWGCESGVLAYITGLLAYESRVLTYLAGVLSHIACLLANVAGLFADFASVLPDVAGLLTQ